MAAVVVCPPAMAPSRIGNRILRIQYPTANPTSSGITVAIAPNTSSCQPALARPLLKLGPALMPTTATNRHNPKVSMNHWAPGGTLPNVGYLPRSQPKTRPMISAPPDVDSEIGTPPACSAGIPMQPPSTMPSPTQIMSVA